MVKDIKLDKLVEEYTNLATESMKAQYLEETVKVEKYIPYVTKIASAENVVKSSAYITETGSDGKSHLTDKFRISSPMRYLFTICCIIDLYTNIEVDKTNRLGQYDLLNENGLVEKLLELIPDKDVSEFKVVLNMCADDLMTNEYNVQSYISKQVNRFGDVFEKVTEPLAPVVDNFLQKLSEMDDKQLERVNGKVNKILKVIK